MLVDSLIVPECIYRPGSFSGLMTVYESNYIKLRHLIPGLDEREGVGDTRISTAERDCDLYFDLLMREPYTTTLKLTYWFDVDAGGAVADPDLTLRVYHDARLVEAVAGRESHTQVARLPPRYGPRVRACLEAGAPRLKSRRLGS